jgi:threonine dehydrogenase-like Zn-dependent dehydrogenase
MECAQFIAQRQIPADKVFTHRFRLDQAAEAYRLFDMQKMGKGVFIM